jgi:hypothetical protein
LKSQTDMIVAIVAVLLALIMAGVFFGTKRKPVQPAPPEQVNVSPPQYKQGSVVYSNSLPGGGGGGAQGGQPGSSRGGAMMGGPGAAGAGGPQMGGTAPAATGGQRPMTKGQQWLGTGTG